MLLRLIVTSDFLTLKTGAELRIPLSDVDDEDAIETMTDNLLMGSLANHCRVEVGAKDSSVSLVTLYDCECFGHRAKEGDVVVSFPADGTPKQRKALGEALRLGQLGEHVDASITTVEQLAADAAAAKAAADAAAKAAADAAKAAEDLAAKRLAEAAANGGTAGGV